MDDNVIQRPSAFERKLMEIETDRALSRNDIARTSPLRNEILSRGQIIVDFQKPAFRVTNDEGTLLTADGFIAERMRDPQGSIFPADKTRVCRNDETKLRDNFAAIAAGDVVVEN